MKKIAFEDIRKGMTIAVVNPELIDRGVSYPRVAVVHSQDQAGDWRTEERNHLTYREFGEVEEYYLISGPSLPEEPGSVIANVVLSSGEEFSRAFRHTVMWMGQRKDGTVGAFTAYDVATFDLAKVEVV